MKAIVAGATAVALGSVALLLGCREPQRLQASEARSPEAVASETSPPMLVNCGVGQQALVRTVQVAGRTLPQVECVAVAPVAAPLYTDSLSLAQPVAYRTPALPVIERTEAPTRVVYRDRPVTSTRSTSTSAPVRASQTRSWKKSALIIGGAAAGGAGVGAIIDGGSGAKKGAVIGGVAGTIYDIATRTKN